MYSEDDTYTPMPEPVRSLWFNGKIADAKVKLIMILLSSTEDKRIKGEDLRRSFHSNTLKKYLREIQEDGIVWIEQLRRGGGKPAHVYHTNEIHKWHMRELKEAALHEKN